ncbi:hypothetical protein AB6813_17605 [bacterium RCC_150]
MNNLFFWIIVCFWLIPMGVRMYNRSRRRRMQNEDYRSNLPGSLPYPPQNYPGQYPPGRYDPRPYDPSQYDDGGYSPTQPSPYQPGPGPSPVVFPSGSQPPVAPAPPDAPPSSAPLPSTQQPQGYRARKLAELDQKFSDGKIAMEDYMKLRQEIMNG